MHQKKASYDYKIIVNVLLVENLYGLTKFKWSDKIASRYMYNRKHFAGLQVVWLAGVQTNSINFKVYGHIQLIPTWFTSAIFPKQRNNDKAKKFKLNPYMTPMIKRNQIVFTYITFFPLKVVLIF